MKECKKRGISFGVFGGGGWRGRVKSPAHRKLFGNVLGRGGGGRRKSIEGGAATEKGREKKTSCNRIAGTHTKAVGIDVSTGGAIE